MENKNVPGNNGGGLTDSPVEPSESEPLKTKKNNNMKKLKESKKKDPEKGEIEIVNVRNEEQGVQSTSSGSESDDENESSGNTGSSGGKRKRQRKRDLLAVWAHKCRLNPRKALIYLIFCVVFVFILFFILILMASLWPEDQYHDVCQSAHCHLMSSQVRIFSFFYT